MRIAYADPPYPGQSRKHYGDHPDYAGEVDHAKLIAKLNDYDGWILHTASTTLEQVLPHAPGARICAWVKPFVKRGLAGVKPERVVHWLLRCVGAVHADEITDLYPGTGAVGRAVETWRSQMVFEDEILEMFP